MIEIKFSENDIVILGLGGHGSMCIDILLNQKKFNLVGFIDKFKIVDKKYNLKYLGTLDNLDYLIDKGLKNLIIGIGFVGNLKKRDKYFSDLSAKINIPTIIHNKAVIEESATVHKGCQIMAGSIIGSNVIIESNCIVNIGSLISHDSIVKKSSHITPGAILAGGVKIGNRSTIGMGATIFLGLQIGNDVIVGDGAVILKDVPDNATIVGNPGTIIK